MTRDELDRSSIDPDSEVGLTSSPPAAGRPVHVRWRYLGLVALGGALGTGLREAFALRWPAADGTFPTTIFIVNIVGAFVLGVLLEGLSLRGSDAGRRRATRLFVGTGILGGFTTYSSLATSVAGLATGHAWVAFVYAAASLVVGFLASIGGIAVAGQLHRVGSRDGASR